jgi:hypothetical protein
MIKMIFSLINELLILYATSISQNAMTTMLDRSQTQNLMEIEGVERLVFMYTNDNPGFIFKSLSTLPREVEMMMNSALMMNLMQVEQVLTDRRQMLREFL